MGEHRWPERRGIAVDRLGATAFQPGEEFEIGRPHAGPDQFHFLGVLVAELGRRGLRKPCGNANPQLAGYELEQGPAAGLVQSIAVRIATRVILSPEIDVEAKLFAKVKCYRDVDDEAVSGLVAGVMDNCTGDRQSEAGSA